MADHRATPEQWARLEICSAPHATYLLELRARVEALEAAAKATVKESLTVQPTPEPRRIVQLTRTEHILDAIADDGTAWWTTTSGPWVQLPPLPPITHPTPEPAPAGGLVWAVTASHMHCSPEIARAAIRAVADWLDRQQEVPVGSATASADYFAAMLREEADR